MQIDIDTKILEAMFAHAATAERLVSYIDDKTVVDDVVVGNELAKSVREFRRLIAELLGEPDSGPPGEDSAPGDEPVFGGGPTGVISRSAVPTTCSECSHVRPEPDAHGA